MQDIAHRIVAKLKIPSPDCFNSMCGIPATPVLAQIFNGTEKGGSDEEYIAPPIDKP